MIVYKSIDVDLHPLPKHSRSGCLARRHDLIGDIQIAIELEDVPVFDGAPSFVLATACNGRGQMPNSGLRLLDTMAWCSSGSSFLKPKNVGGPLR